MMSGDGRENDKQNEENGKTEPQGESVKPSSTDESSTDNKGGLSNQSEKKSYPFSVPGDEAAEVTSDGGANTSDLTTHQEPEDSGIAEETPAMEDVVSALETEIPQEEAFEAAEDVAEDLVDSEPEETSESILDEGLFSDEVLPEEGMDTADEEALAQEAAATTDDRITDHVPDEETVYDTSEQVEPYISQTSAKADQVHGDVQQEGPKHAFDTGEPVMSEEEYSQDIKKKSGLGVVLVSVIIMFLLVGVVIGGGFFYVKLKFDAPGPQPQQLSHVIKPKQGLKEIAADLEDKGIIEDKNIFMIGSYISGENKSLQAGEFEFAPNASMKEVLETISKGKVIQHKITLAEGLTSQQIVEIINDNPVLTGEIDTLPAEGSLLPETYNFTRGMTRQQIIDRMQKAQAALVEKLWPARADGLGVVTPADAITLASIVEKETGLSNERGRVAAVFNNRLNKNMRLQSDPTVIYGIVGGEGKLDRPIRRSDLDEQTPYNTYKIEGLPPTPIANPGRASIEAVLRPARTDDLYFVADGTGGHAFATTLKEHNENVARWRKIEKGVEAPQPPVAKDLKPEAEKNAKKASAPKPVEELKSKATEKAGVLQKTLTPKNDARSIAETPLKADKVLPKAKPKAEIPAAVKEVTDKKESLSEKVRAIFVKPEEAPLPRSKPNAALQQGVDKINVTPLPEQKIPAVPRVNTQQQVPQTPQQTIPQTTQPGGEPTPELEASTPARPAQRPFNPFED